VNLDLTLLAYSSATAVLGFLLGFLIRRKMGREIVQEAEKKSADLLRTAENEAKTIKKEAEFEAKDIKLQAKEHLDKELQEKQREWQQVEKRLVSREENLEKRFGALEDREEEFKAEVKSIGQEREKLKSLTANYEQKVEESRKALEKVAGLTKEEAKKELQDSLMEEVRRDTARMIQDEESRAKEQADNTAKKIVSVAMERLASDYVLERTISVVQLPGDDMKGRIIGREGRNIRALEAATGIDIIIDDTPEAVILSGFNPVRREIARLTLEGLIADGRIHPSRIEEMVEKATKDVDKTIKQHGEKVCLDLNLAHVHPELVKLIGALRYRYSYAQNILTHSVEVAHIAGMMAAELGLDIQKAKRAALMHDMGKALTHEIEGSHAIIGMEYAIKYGESEDVAHAIGAHHEDIPQETPLDFIVDAADALSGARPGARKEVLEAYVKRIEDLERISTSFKGVKQAYAIQAGREIRVMVGHEDVSDAEAHMISRDIAKKIEEEMTYPGQIKVTVIRETRATEYAK